jgi:hypothetical protein
VGAWDGYWKILQREIRPDDHRRLIEDSLRELETVKG